jgi:hypothetical protein
MTTTKPGRRPSDYKPRASVIAAQQKAAQIAAQEVERVRASEETNKASMALPVDENALRKEQLVSAGIGSKKVAAKLTLLTVLFIGLIVGSICMFINNLVTPAVITLVIAVFALLGLSLWIKRLYTALVNELGKEETIDTLLSMAKSKKK